MYKRQILHRPLEVIHRDVAAKCARSQIVIRQKRRSGKADARCRGQQVHHVGGKNPVLAAVRFVGHDQNVVVGIDGLQTRLVKLLNEGKDKAGIAFELLHQVLTAGRHECAGIRFAQQAAVFKGVADLLVEFIPVREHDNGGRARKLAPDLLRQK